MMKKYLGVALLTSLAFVTQSMNAIHLKDDKGNYLVVDAEKNEIALIADQEKAAEFMIFPKWGPEKFGKKDKKEKPAKAAKVKAPKSKTPKAKTSKSKSTIKGKTAKSKVVKPKVTKKPTKAPKQDKMNRKEGRKGGMHYQLMLHNREGSVLFPMGWNGEKLVLANKKHEKEVKPEEPATTPVDKKTKKFGKKGGKGFMGMFICTIADPVSPETTDEQLDGNKVVFTHREGEKEVTKEFTFVKGERKMRGNKQEETKVVETPKL